MYKEGNEKSRQHSDFPGGHPPEYYPSLRLLNFAERTGYGALSLRWPSTNTSVALPNCSLQTSNVKPRTTTDTTHQNEKRKNEKSDILCWLCPFACWCTVARCVECRLDGEKRPSGCRVIRVRVNCLFYAFGIRY